VSARPDVAQAAGNLSRSLATLANTSADYVRVQLDRADDAIATEGHRQLWMMLSAAALLLWLSVSVVFAGLAIVIACPEPYRVTAAAAVAAAFLALAATAAFVLLRKWRERPMALDWIAQVTTLIAGCRRLLR